MNTYYPTNFTIIGCVTLVKLAEYAKLHFCHTYGKSGQYTVILPNGLIKTHAKLSDVYKSIRDFITNEFNNINDEQATIAAAYEQGLVERVETQEYFDREPIATKKVNITNVNTLETMQTVRDECFVWLTRINGTWLTEDRLHEQGWYEDHTTTG